MEGWQVSHKSSDLEWTLHGLVVSMIAGHQDGDFEASLYSPIRLDDEMVSQIDMVLPKT